MLGFDGTGSVCTGLDATGFVLPPAAVEPVLGPAGALGAVVVTLGFAPEGVLPPQQTVASARQVYSSNTMKLRNILQLTDLGPVL